MDLHGLGLVFTASVLSSNCYSLFLNVQSYAGIVHHLLGPSGHARGNCWAGPGLLNCGGHTIQVPRLGQNLTATR